ncbi:transporter substrate-binding domain-containing protein [Vibrio sp. JC009]|uniref:substrate-binding periplasmic protein n=1 Tax=Vibrio sp. JC009 TaxID=2912314 RepID=UPI0023B07252|nr:transporter substrate-binding domain-containing protein [Vibrio sp. JC009]WED24176.1 transporter substrate-binding domain-containing protein [Vibrio sp. JC009]
MLFISCLSLASCLTYAGTEKDALRVSFTEFVPWKTVTAGGNLSGIDIELMAMIAERMDLDLEVTPYPWKRGLRRLETGDVDIITSLLRRPQREAFAYFIEPPYVTQSNKAFFVLKGNENTISKYDDLKGLTIGTFDKNHYFEPFDHDTSLDKFSGKSTEQLLKMLLAGRLDTFIMTEEVGEFKIKELGFEGQIVKADYKYSKPMNVYLALSKNSPLSDRRDEISTILTELIQEGIIEKLKDKYLHSQE